MIPDAIPTNIGAVTSQLMVYEFEELSADRASFGERQAVASSRGWIDNILTAEFQPSVDVIGAIHRRDEKTCDAVRFAYEVQGYEITVSQTIFLMLIQLAPRREQPPVTDDSIEKLVNALSQRLFRYTERHKLVFDRKEGGAFFGRQAREKNKPSQEMDWLDAIEWWYRSPQFGFVIPKFAAPNQATVISLDLKENQIWFERYGKPRSR